MHLGQFATMIFSFTGAPDSASLGSDAIWLWIALGVGALALVAALVLAKIVLSHDTGTAEMRIISDAI